uniref:Sushi domain-containing protein n=1 Tax=Tetranychus urticae TaxID=32264 RepID=T1K687_TETUR
MINIPAGAIVISGCSTVTNSVCSIRCTSTGVVQSQICQVNGLWSGTPFNCFGTGFGQGFGTNFGQGFGANFGQGFIGQANCASLAVPVNGLYSGNCSPGIVGGTCAFQCRPGFALGQQQLQPVYRKLRLVGIYLSDVGWVEVLK